MSAPDPTIAQRPEALTGEADFAAAMRLLLLATADTPDSFYAKITVREARALARHITAQAEQIVAAERQREVALCAERDALARLAAVERERDEARAALETIANEGCQKEVLLRVAGKDIALSCLSSPVTRINHRPCSPCVAAAALAARPAQEEGR